ncbi:thioredoxin-1-like [Varroa jacobsoni]|uniref:Thioredoxin n=1 Tax=Varroa destructor TaxID=109461 RepID=A0A7M7KGL1_VARDE|nr:thioredoxin-1-like [Varroa destructor]XP_022704671.1 thioredoxin-1-like [Varroa jacobsoni]
MVHQVASHEEFVKLLATPDKVVFVDFHAKWCRPCKVIGPVFEKISSQYPDCLFLKVDIDEVEEAAEEHLVQMVPTFMAFKNGKKIDGIVSAKEEDLTAFIAKHKG